MIVVAERLVSLKFITVYNKRLSVFPSPSSATNSNDHLPSTVTGSLPELQAGQQTTQLDYGAQDHSPLKKTVCREDHRRDIGKSGSNLLETEDQSPSEETNRRKSDKSDVQDGSELSQSKGRSPLKKTSRNENENVQSDLLQTQGYSPLKEKSRHQNDETSEDTMDSGSRTIYVHEVPDDLADVIEVWFESPKHSGGTVDKYYFDVDNHVAVVTFAHRQGRKFFTYSLIFSHSLIFEMIVTISLYK